MRNIKPPFHITLKKGDDRPDTLGLEPTNLNTNKAMMASFTLGKSQTSYSQKKSEGPILASMVQSPKG